MPTINNFFQALKELCFPLSCISCSCKIGIVADNIHLCTKCRQNIEFIQPPLCSCCGKEFSDYGGENHRCSPCITKPPCCSKVRSILSYNETLAPIIHAFKYQSKTIGRTTFAALKIQSTVVGDLIIPDYIVPVPLHIKRLRERGFNQAQLLANVFFPQYKHIINTDILRRCRNTTPQTKLSGQQRRKNLKNAFCTSTKYQIDGKTFLLLDDVFTTGTTLEECARVLKKGGAKDVQALTLARAKG